MAADTFLGDAFKVRMDLGHVEVKAWPKVYEAEDGTSILRSKISAN